MLLFICWVGFFLAFFPLFFFFSLFPRFCGGFLPWLPTQTSPWCREVPPTPVLSEIRTVISVFASPLGGFGALIKQKGRLSGFFPLLFYYFITKHQVLEHRSKWVENQLSCFNLLKENQQEGTQGLSLLVAFSVYSACLCVSEHTEFIACCMQVWVASKLKMNGPAFCLLCLSILHRNHCTSLQCWTNLINRWLSVTGQYWDWGSAPSIECCFPLPTYPSLESPLFSVK